MGAGLELIFYSVVGGLAIPATPGTSSAKTWDSWNVYMQIFMWPVFITHIVMDSIWIDDYRPWKILDMVTQSIFIVLYYASYQGARDYMQLELVPAEDPATILPEDGK